MFVINEDKSIYITRGDIAFFEVSASLGEDSGLYKFQAGDVVRFKVFEKKACENVLLQKDFGITKETEIVEIRLEEKETRIGEIISKPKDYWYEIELNPFDNPQTIVGYDDDGAKIFRLFPEGKDIDEDPIPEEEIDIIDTELSMTSTRPVQNQAIARAVVKLSDEIGGLKESGTGATEEQLAQIEQNKKDISNLSEQKADKESLTLGVGADGYVYLFVNGSPQGNGLDIKADVIEGDVIGYVDTNNNIVLTGALLDGTYSVKYEMEDGTVINIGDMVLGESEPEPVEVINQIPLSINADGTLFNNGQGYKTGYRLSLSSGTESQQDGTEVTGFIPVTKNSVIRIKNIAYDGDTTRGVVGYDANFTKLSTGNGTPIGTLFGNYGYDDGNGVRRTSRLGGHTHFNSDDLKYIRLCSTDINETSIITVDQEIV